MEFEGRRTRSTPRSLLVFDFIIKMVGVFKAGEKGQKNTQGGSGQANDQSERSEDQGSAEVSREERESKAEAHQA